MTGRVLFNHIFNIIGTQGLAKFAPSNKILDLTQRPDGIFVLLGKHRELHLLAKLFLCSAEEEPIFS